MRLVAARLLLMAGGLILAACSTTPAVVSGLPSRSAVGEFSLEARFALHLERPYEAPQSAAGRLSWQHSRSVDHILVSNPLGQGIAEIESNSTGARLRRSDGRIQEASDAATLLEEATGYTLPLGDLPAWLLGHPASKGQIHTDPLGRPQSLVDAGWRVEYNYDNEDADALPSRLTLRRDDGLEVRLRIEEWRSIP